MMDPSPPPPAASRSRTMAGYRWLGMFAAGLLALQFIVGLAGTLTPRAEIFPFASWFLFSLVPDRVVSYDLLLRGTERRPLAPPRPFNRAGGLVKSPHSVTVYQLIQGLGRAAEGRRGSEVTRLRREIEAQFSSAPGMRYDLVRVSYRLADRWKGKPTPPPETVASFEVPP